MLNRWEASGRPLVAAISPIGVGTYTGQQLVNEVSQADPAALGAAQTGLDAVGVVDLTPAVDTFGALLSLLRGDLSSALISLIGAAIPYGGDAFKVAKAAKGVPDVLDKASDLGKISGKVDAVCPSVSNRVPRGSANPAVSKAAGRGSTLHSDKPGHLPDQLRQRYPETEFDMKKPGVPGQDIQVTGGKHPSDYPDSTWPKGIDYGDFKPDSAGGRKTFASDQKNKWSEPTHMLPCDQRTGNLQ